MKNISLTGRKIDEKKTVKVHAGDLQVGMFVSELDRPWLESPFLLQGFELKTEEDILAVQSVCDFVFVDVLQSRTVVYESLAGTRTTGITGTLTYAGRPKAETRFDQEMSKAEGVHGKTSNLIRTFVDDIKFGRSLDVQVAKSAVSECVSSILRNPEALMFLTQIRNKDEYTSQHSFNVCVYAINLGRQVGLSHSELENLGVCGLLHDMGKIQIPLEILNKDGQLNQEEFAVMRKHARYGRDILMSGRNVFSGTVDVAFGHHENLDGTGYPRGLEGHQMNLFTKIVSVVDKYDAIISNRVYQNGRTHVEAIGILNKMAKEKIDPGLTMSFIGCMGIFPSGSVVELTSGEIAVVIEQNPSSRLRPTIVVCRDAEKRPVAERFVDLVERETDDQGRPYAIKKLHRAEAFGIDMRKFQELLGKKIWD